MKLPAALTGGALGYIAVGFIGLVIGVLFMLLFSGKSDE